MVRENCLIRGNFVKSLKGIYHYESHGLIRKESTLDDRYVTYKWYKKREFVRIDQTFFSDRIIIMLEKSLGNKI